MNFALIAASSDTNKQKKLQFGQAGTTFRKGHSKLTIASGAGFDAEGTAANPTLIDMLPSGGTYYTFVDSGVFTVNYASITHMDASGIWLSTGPSGSGPFSINNSTFDLVGNTNVKGVISTSTLITLNNVINSTITLENVTYSSSTTNTHIFNYTILGSSVGLQWTNQLYNGTLTGAANTNSDTTQKHILWEPVGCSTITSIVNGNWSSSSTWDAGFVPTACNPVNIVVGTTVTLDIPTATASTTTIEGTLKFNRSGDNEFMLFNGSMSVNAGGTLDMGTGASPIPQGTTAYLILALDSASRRYGMVVNPGGNFLVYGAAKTPWTTLSSPSSIGSGSPGNFVVGDTTGWQVGDTITIDTEAVTIATLPGGNHVTVNGTLGQVHVATYPVVVANLTRTVVVRSSGTTTATKSWIKNLATNVTSFNVNYGDFQYLGQNSATKYGIDFESAKGSISSSTIPGMDIGELISNSSPNNILAANNVYSESGNGHYRKRLHDDDIQQCLRECPERDERHPRHYLRQLQHAPFQ